MTDTSLVFNVLAKDNASPVLARIGGAVKAMGAAAAAGLAILATQSVAAARDLNETQSKVGVIFGKSASAVQAFAEMASVSLGQSQQAALDGAATFATYGKGAGLAGDKLVTFSTGLTSLASDMASFSNSSPEEAIQAIGAALRGESDPIERYGVLLNESVVKQQALKMGIIKTISGALTPQQRVLAATAAIYAQTRDAQGDFARTSGSLANQQRILTAQWSNFKAQLGQSLLPIVTQFVTLLTAQVMPALTELWAQHGPAVQRFLSNATVHFGQFVDRLRGFDFKAFGADIGAVFGKLGPAFADMRAEIGPGFADTIKVTGVVFGFLAEHADLLAKALPYLAAAWLVVKGAQMAANVAQAISPALSIAAAVANRRLAASNVELAAAMRAYTLAARGQAASTIAGTVATTANDAATKRSVSGIIGHRVASIAAAVGTGIWAAATWALNIAMSPIGLIVIGIVAAIALLVAGILWLWNNNEGFRNFVLSAWTGIKAAIGAVVNWITGTAWPFLKRTFDNIANTVVMLYTTWRTWLDRIVGFVSSLPGRISGAARGMWDGIKDAFRSAVNWIIGKWNRLNFRIPPISVPGLGQIWGGATLSTPDIPFLAQGGSVRQSGIAVVGERGPELVHLNRGADVTPLRRATGGSGLVIDSGGSRVDDMLLEVLRRAVRRRGGNVQIVIGGRTA